MADGEEVSVETKLKIAANFILKAPFGELNEVVKDVRQLVQADAEFDQSLPGILKEYNERHHVVAAGNGGKVLICQAGATEDGKYVDPEKMRLVTVDHEKATITSFEEIPESDRNAKVEALRAPTQTAVAQYAADSLAAGCAAVHGSMDGEGAVTLAIALCGSKLNKRNYWTGAWRSAWQVTVPSGGSAAELTGTVTCMVHYFEDGNVRMEAKREHSASVAGAGSDLADAIAVAIREAEAQHEAWIGESYTTMGDASFKALRRKMPITQTKFQWDKVAAYSLAAELNKGQGSG